MRPKTDVWKALPLLAALFCVGAAYYASTSQIPPSIIEIQEALTLEPDFKTTYVSGGMKQTVSTYQKAGDSITETAAIHAAKVAALLVEFPQDE